LPDRFVQYADSSFDRVEGQITGERLDRGAVRELEKSRAEHDAIVDARTDQSIPYEAVAFAGEP